MSSVFYEQGLRFSCVRCSNCCRHEPGYVFLSQEDLSLLAVGLELSEDEVMARYCRRISIGGFSRVSLEERPNYDCVFWEEGGCAVYEHRPLQCRSYPFWAQNLSDQEAWDAEAASCPGIGSGRLYSRREIDEWLERRQQTRMLT